MCKDQLDKMTITEIVALHLRDTKQIVIWSRVGIVLIPISTLVLLFFK